MCIPVISVTHPLPGRFIGFIRIIVINFHARRRVGAAACRGTAVVSYFVTRGGAIRTVRTIPTGPLTYRYTNRQIARGPPAAAARTDSDGETEPHPPDFARTRREANASIR